MTFPSVLLRRRRDMELVCRACGVCRQASVPVGIAIERWLAGYPCPDCGVLWFVAAERAADDGAATCIVCGERAERRLHFCLPCGTEFNGWYL